MDQEQILAILVRNQPGVLMRVAGLFSRRGYNIDSLAVGTTENAEFSRMTVTMQADEAVTNQVCKQLAKLAEVEQVKVLPRNQSVKRSLMMLKVHAGKNRLEILRLGDEFRARAADITGDVLTFNIMGADAKLKAFVELMRPYGILEMVQTGLVAMERGAGAMHVDKSRYEWPEAVEHKVL